MEAYDIIIQGGQSNSEGSGIGPVEKAYEPSENILYLDVDKTVEVLPEGGLKITYADKPFQLHIAEERLWQDNQILGDFSLTFSKKYIENGLLDTGRKILIVRAAIGGTGFQTTHWGLQDRLFLKMLEMTDYALSLNPNNRVAGFLWHQGENDAVEGNTPQNYRKQLLDMLSFVREKYGNMPFVAGDFVNEWKMLNIDICNPIVNVIREIVEEVDSAAFVETADLLSNNQTIGNGDNIHFSRQSLYVLGERYFNEFQRIKREER